MESNAGSTTLSKDARRRATVRVAIPLPLVRPRNGTLSKAQVATTNVILTPTTDQTQSAGASEKDVSEEKRGGAHNGVNGGHEKAEEVVEAQSSTENVRATGDVSARSVDNTNGDTQQKEHAERSKKPTQIRTELPPAFVPLNGTPSSKTDYSRPGSTHITFSTDESGTPSPIPYSTFSAPRHSPHASVFIPPQQPINAFNGNGNGNGNGYTYTRANGHSSRHQQRDSYDYTPFNDLTMTPTYRPLPPSAHHAMDNSNHLTRYIWSLYDSNTFADIRLELYYEQSQTSTTLNGHRSILARSPTLLDIMQQSQRLNIPGKWMDERATTTAIKWLYGGLLFGDVDMGSTPSEQLARQRSALGCIAAGQFLGLPTLAQQAIDMVSFMLSWDFLPSALEFVLEGGLPSSWSHVKTQPVNEPSATPLLHAIMSFMISQFPHDLQPDNTAPDLIELHRLPIAPYEGITHRSSRSVNDPRLTRLRFGEIGGTAISVISSILFSLPYELLVALFEHPALLSRFGVDHLASIARSVVGERENRRLKVKVLSGDLRYEELVEPDNAYLKISRRIKS